MYICLREKKIVYSQSYIKSYMVKLALPLYYINAIFSYSNFKITQVSLFPLFYPICFLFFLYLSGSRGETRHRNQMKQNCMNPSPVPQFVFHPCHPFNDLLSNCECVSWNEIILHTDMKEHEIGAHRAGQIVCPLLFLYVFYSTLLACSLCSLCCHF